jgi:8-oxo-dGTP pyrophosphatase MutT (NUDIX family)
MVMASTAPRSWTRLRSGAPVDYRVIKVREEWVGDPRNGSEHHRVVIDAPDWVNVIPVAADGRVVLIRQFRIGIWCNTLEIPGGIVEPGEKPIDAASRELEEETGYRPAQIELLGFIHPNPAIQSNRCYSFIATGCKKVHGGKQDSGEDIIAELVRPAEIAELIRSAQITHALVVAAFQLHALRSQAGR